MIEYVYNNKQYKSLWQIRELIPNVIFPVEPTKEQFKALGITVIEVIPEPPTLEQLKENKFQLISANYTEYDRIGTVITSLGFPVQVGIEHCNKLDGAIRFAEVMGAETIYITDANDETHYDISIVSAKQILIEQMSTAMLAHQKKQELRYLVQIANSSDDLDKIEIKF